MPPSKKKKGLRGVQESEFFNIKRNVWISSDLKEIALQVYCIIYNSVKSQGAAISLRSSKKFVMQPEKLFFCLLSPHFPSYEYFLIQRTSAGEGGERAFWITAGIAHFAFWTICHTCTNSWVQDIMHMPWCSNTEVGWNTCYSASVTYFMWGQNTEWSTKNQVLCTCSKASSQQNQPAVYYRSL